MVEENLTAPRKVTPACWFSNKPADSKHGLERQLRFQPVFLDPFGIVELGNVFVARVAEDRHDGLSRPALAGVADRAGYVDAGGKTEEKSLFAPELLNDGEGRLVFDPVSLVDRKALDVLRHAALADTFGE